MSKSVPLGTDILQGIALALAEVHRSHGEATICLDVLKGHALTLNDFIDAGVEDYDLDALREIYLVGPSAD